MKVTPLKIPDVKLIEPNLFEDQRGSFFESFNQKKSNEFVEADISFVQDNQSKSTEGVLRGLHCQRRPYAQGKLVRVLIGEIFDVAVDLRNQSKTFGQWLGLALSEQNNKQLWIPEGFAHGFLTMEANTEIAYKVSRYYSREHDVSLLASSKELDLELPIPWETMHFSEKDQLGISILEI